MQVTPVMQVIPCYDSNNRPILDLAAIMNSGLMDFDLGAPFNIHLTFEIYNRLLEK